MSSDLAWVHQYCLSCDRQTDGATYCSESCRLYEFERSSPASSTPSTPAEPHSQQFTNFSWAAPRSQPKFYLSPAYDFSNAQPYQNTTHHSQRSVRLSMPSTPRGQLSPSSSNASLVSLQSNSSGGDNNFLSDRERKQLRDYASSFENARLQRRRSY